MSAKAHGIQEIISRIRAEDPEEDPEKESPDEEEDPKKPPEEEPEEDEDPENPEEDPENPPLKEVLWLRLDEINEKDRAFLWAYGLMQVPGFFDEIKNWGDEISYPGKKEKE